VPGDGEGLSYRFNADLHVQHETGDDLLFVFGKYTLSMRAAAAEGVDPSGDKDVEGTDPEDVASFSFELNGLFAVEHQPDEPFTESELTAFGQTTGQFALYPYARELVANLSGRMGLPPLHMGVMRLHLESRDG
jgi:hypothetical protein